MSPLFAAADELGLPITLETTDPANYPFYDALGFGETAPMASCPMVH